MHGVHCTEGIEVEGSRFPSRTFATVNFKVPGLGNVVGQSVLTRSAALYIVLRGAGRSGCSRGCPTETCVVGFRATSMAITPLSLNINVADTYG